MAAAAVAAIAVVLSLHTRSTTESLPGYRVVRDVRLPGNTSRFDYQSFDPKRHLLFIAHLGDSSVLVYDTNAERVVSEVRDVSDVHGVLAVPSLGKLFATATGVDQVDVIDESSLQVVDRIPAGEYPDGLAYDPADNEVFVSDESGRADTVIDVGTGRRVATIPLGGSVGNTRFDPADGSVYAAVPPGLAVIDPTTDHVSKYIAVPGCDGPHGLYLIPSVQVAFVACEDNSRVKVVDLRAMKETQSFEVATTPDVLAFDRQRSRLYVATESGTIDVFGWTSGRLTKVTQGFGGPNAHSVAVDPATGDIYLPLVAVMDHPVLRELRPET